METININPNQTRQAYEQKQDQKEWVTQKIIPPLIIAIIVVGITKGVDYIEKKKK
jgi:hypothetical protein